MKILVIGSGAREHALCKALHRSHKQPAIFCFASSLNPGITQLTQDYAIGKITDCEAVVAQAEKWGIEIAIIGPEAPLEQGLADALWQTGIAVIGPTADLARIETSKEFARDLMQKNAIPGVPHYQKFDSLDGVEACLAQLGDGNYVIKANGLMGGKGVKVAGDHLHSFQEAIAFCEEIIASKQTFIIEEKLIGEEFSFMCFADGKQLVPMPLVQDHKRAFDGDAGPNTGGMGSYSCADHGLPFLTASEIEAAWAINNAVFQALTVECQNSYIGFLYGSFIATAKGVYVIEFNARLGDPESLNVLSVLQSDMVTLCMAMITGHLHSINIEFAPLATVCKYAVPKGYPDHPARDFAIDYQDVEHLEQLYLAAVDERDGQLVATGSRTVAYVGIAADLPAAETRTEQEINRVQGDLFHRQDIGTAQLINQRIAHMAKIRKI